MRLTALAAGGAALLAGLASAGAARAASEWSARTEAGQVTAAVVKRGKGQVLTVAVRTDRGVRIMPPVLRIDVPALVRDRVRGRFPMTVRGKDGQPPRASIPLAGALAFAGPDSNDGMLRVEFRYCPPEPARCGVERVDIPVKAGTR
ncbi:hypothetical protein [Azospirillum sp. SYSU D00513]|uniref:hypothetical protein n=2 Tax=Pseudomonadati TaxID=3379134 RepID=UPI001A974201|nr:hypothetical protein [Azospirillum sp. SYSU D00513]